MRALLIAVIAAVAVTAMQAPAAADDPRKTAERYFRSGERLFGAGEFVAAGRAFEDAFAIMPLPAIVFSAAQAYRLAWVRKKDPIHLQRAAELYQLYLDKDPKGARVVDASAALGELEAVLRGHTGRVGPVAPRSTGVTITSSIVAVEVGLDGGAITPLPIVRDLAPGKHTLVAAADGYAGRTIEFQAVEGVVVPVEIELDALPARVTITAERGSTIAVDGRGVGAAPLAMPLELPAGRHFVAVTRRGRVGYGHELELARDQAVTIAARQPATGQRRAARWVLIGAGALTVGAGVAATAALLADGDAADLAARQATVGLSLAERDRYESLRGQRDDRRALAFGLGGAALAVGVTGALLYWFDRDDAERAPSIAPSIAPTVSGDGGGVVFAGSF